MPRPRPQLTPAQLKSIAAHSRGQLLDEARQREIDAYSASLDRSLAEVRARSQRLDKGLAWWGRYGPWIARVVLVPILIVAIGLVWGVVMGLWSGEINAISRSSKAMVGRIDHPVAYWLAVVHHSAMAAFVTYVATVAFQLSRSRMEPPMNSSDTVELFDVTAHASERQPVDGSAGMELHAVDPAGQHGNTGHPAATASTSSNHASS